MGPVGGQQAKLDQTLATLRGLDASLSLLEMIERGLHDDCSAQLALSLIRDRFQLLLDDAIGAVQAAGARE